jgi:hypothetical protein
MTRKRRGPGPDDFDAQLERFAELSLIEDRLLLIGSADRQGPQLRHRRVEILSAIRQWNVRFLGLGDGNGAPL